MIKTTQLKKNRFCREEKLASNTNKSLSILLFTGGFSFSIKNIDSNEVILYSEYNFDNDVNNDLKKLLDKVSTIFINDEDLQHEFKDLLVIHQNNLATLVPDKYFDKNKLRSFIDLNIESLENDYITFDQINNLQIKNIYIPFVNVNNYLFKNFGEFNFKHHSTILLEKLQQLRLNNNIQTDQFYVNVTNNTIDCIVFKSASFQYYNSFTFDSENDFLFFIIMISEKLQYNFNTHPLTLMGRINLIDKNYKICKKIIKNIEFISNNSNFLNIQKNLNNHKNFILLG